MSVYNINGNNLENILNVNGEGLQTGYDISGNIVYTASTPYDNYTVTKAWNYYRYAQGIDVHNDVVAIWDDHAQTITLKAISDGTLISTLNLGITDHGNDISFTQEYYDPTDEFPLLCISTSRFYRITRSSATQVKTFRIPTIKTYTLGYGIAFNEGIMYVSGYLDNDYTESSHKDICVAMLDLNDLTDNGDDTYTPALISYVERPWLPCIQGASFHDGLFWWACGLTGSGDLVAIDPQTGEAVHTLNLGNTGELEGLGWGYNSTDGWFAFIGAVSIGYVKVTFTT